MIKTISVIESHTSAGSKGCVNEDAFGSNHDCAFVIDGATGLGEHQIIDDVRSDAGWLASNAAEYF